MKRYFFSYGPDSRHLHDVVVCELLRDAKMIAKAVNPRAYRISSLTYTKAPMYRGINPQVIEERLF